MYIVRQIDIGTVINQVLLDDHRAGMIRVSRGDNQRRTTFESCSPFLGCINARAINQTQYLSENNNIHSSLNQWDFLITIRKHGIPHLDIWWCYWHQHQPRAIVWHFAQHRLCKHDARLWNQSGGSMKCQKRNKNHGKQKKNKFRLPKCEHIEVQIHQKRCKICFSKTLGLYYKIALIMRVEMIGVTFAYCCHWIDINTSL